MNEFDVEPPTTVVSGNDGDIAGAIATAADVIAGFVGVFAVAALIVAGILWATAAGEEMKVEKARKIIKVSIFGLILALSAWGIVRVVVDLF